MRNPTEMIDVLTKVEMATTIFDLRFIRYIVHQDGFFSGAEMTTINDEIAAREFVIEAAKIGKFKLNQNGN